MDDVVKRILSLMEKECVKASKLTREIGLNPSAVTDWKKGKAKPSYGSIVKIAQYFNVTADYLLTGKENSVSSSVNTNNGNIGVVGQSNAPVTIHSGSNGERVLSKEEVELLRIYNALDFKKRVKFLNAALEIEEE